MGRGAYEQKMRQRLRDLGTQIASARARLAESPDDRMKTALIRGIAQLEAHRETIREKLDALAGEPDATWEELRHEIEDDWDALLQDFEERVAGLA